jgi:dsDNA-specific endonuclease/ATPase MutS2
MGAAQTVVADPVILSMGQGIIVTLWSICMILIAAMWAKQTGEIKELKAALNELDACVDRRFEIREQRSFEAQAQRAALLEGQKQLQGRLDRMYQEMQNMHRENVSRLSQHIGNE